MKVKIDPISIVVLSIILGWGWTELTTEAVCEKQIERNGDLYTIPIQCDSIPN